jgi:glycerophosphoryl diester phosphodiesterase
MLKCSGAMQALEEQAFRPGEDFSQTNGLVAGFQLWDWIGLNPLPAVQAIGSSSPQVSDRAEWMHVQGGPAVPPAVRIALRSRKSEVRERAIHIIAWQADTDSIGALRAMHRTGSANADLIAWAIDKIESLRPPP